MHELSITQELLRIITDRAREAGISKIHRITLKIGSYAGIVTDALLFSFEVLSRGSMTEGAEVVVEQGESDELQVVSFEGD
jgi:hydrogenase nickel incorporation protein HypA/HybF